MKENGILYLSPQKRRNNSHIHFIMKKKSFQLVNVLQKIDKIKKKLNELIFSHDILEELKYVQVIHLHHTFLKKIQNKSIQFKSVDLNV